MQQIAEWLEKLGMSEYAERFAENGICRGAPPSDRSRPKGHRRSSRASADNAGGYRRPCWRTTGSAETSRCSGAKEWRELTSFWLELTRLKLTRSGIINANRVGAAECYLEGLLS